MTSTLGSRDRNDSEYSDATQDIRKNVTGNDEEQQESDYDSAGSDLSENDADASQEQEKKVDDDEDRSNPQYIPKRGTFYEHDDRTAGSTEESLNTTSETASEKKEGSETPSDRRRPPRKSEIIDKWSHDKFNENEQAPKSRDELIAIYGYDIRNEEAPPHARRNRRYGRGPNKYTRTWEDEEAYKQKAAAVPRKPPNPEDFPELNATGKRVSKKPGRQMRPRSRSQPASNESSESNGPVNLRRNASIKTPRSPRPAPKAMPRNVPNSPRPFNNSTKDNKMPPIENLTITTTVNHNSSGPAQRKVNAAHWPAPGDQKRKPAPQTQVPQQNNVSQNKSPQQQSPPAQQKPEQQTQQLQQQQQNQPTESRGSKRYSSLRQRPLAETYSPQPQQVPLPQQPQQNQQQQPPQHRYVADYQPQNNQPSTQHQGSPVPQLHPSQLMHQQMQRTATSQPQHGPSPPHQLPQPQHNPQVTQQVTQQQVRLGLLDQQQLVSHIHHQQHNISQPHAALGQLQQPQGYAPPAMMPAQFMQQASNTPVYAAPPMYAQPPPNPYSTPHQLFQHHNYAAQAGGVTYYSPEVQPEVQPPPRAQRRPTAAIPIVRPSAPDRSTNSSEKENIDRIVENMFVRKPWPAAPNSDNKDKTDARSSQEPLSKESSQPNSLTSSTISESKPSDVKEEKLVEELKPQEEQTEKEESISTDA